MQVLREFAPLALVIASMGAAHAEINLLDSSMYAAIVSGGNNVTVATVNFTSTPGDFASYVYFNGGLGVAGGRTGDQIDIDETIALSWAGGLVIKSFSVSALYNGPEFGDVAEIAQVKAYDGIALVGAGQLQVDAVADNLASFIGTGFGSVSDLSPADGGHFGAWSVSNPFGGATVSRLEFTALKSNVCGSGDCSNQSDFALSSVTALAVPEPETYAMMMVGLAALGSFIGRRRTFK